jgi:hypothetical protein
VLVAPSPKLHDQEVAPVDVFVKATFSGAFPLVGLAVKFAVTGVHAVTEYDLEFDPHGPVAVSVTV